MGPGSRTDGRPEPPQGVLSWLRNLVGWPGAPAAPDTPAERELVQERVRSGPAGVVLPWFLPYFDDQQTVSENTAMRLAYRKMLNSPVVKSALLGKILAATSLDLKVIPRDRRDKQQAADAELVRWNLEDSLEGGVPGLIWSVLSGALIDGYSVSEKIWDREGKGEHKGAYYLRAVKPKDTGQDVILQTDEFRNVVGILGLRYNPGISYHPSNFLIYRHLPLWDLATGMSDLRGVYQSWWMRDTVWKLRAMALEKRSLPVIVGEWNTAQERPAVDSALMMVKSQNWISVPKDTKVTALNIAGGSDEMFARAIQQLDEDIFLGIAGATLQARQGDVNNARGSSAEHRNTADLFISHLTEAISQLFNDARRGLVRDILDLNRVVDVYPKVTLSAVDEKDMVSRLAIYTGLWEMGLETSRHAMYDEFGVEPPDPEDPDDSLGGKADQEAQVAAATIESPYGPADAAAADKVLTDSTGNAMDPRYDVTGPIANEPQQAGRPAQQQPAEQMVEQNPDHSMPASMKVSGGSGKRDKGVGKPISTGAGVDKIGRRYAVVAGRRVPLPPFQSRQHEQAWLRKQSEAIGQRDSGDPWQNHEGKWFKHDGERTVPCAAPEEMAEGKPTQLAQPPKLPEPLSQYEVGEAEPSLSARQAQQRSQGSTANLRVGRRPVASAPPSPQPAQQGQRRQLSDSQMQDIYGGTTASGQGHDIVAPPAAIRLTQDEQLAARRANVPPLPQQAPVAAVQPILEDKIDDTLDRHFSPRRAQKTLAAAATSVPQRIDQAVDAIPSLIGRAARAVKEFGRTGPAPVAPQETPEPAQQEEAAQPAKKQTVSRAQAHAQKLKAYQGKVRSPAALQKLGAQLDEYPIGHLDEIASHLFPDRPLSENAPRRDVVAAIINFMHGGRQHASAQPAAQERAAPPLPQHPKRGAKQHAEAGQQVSAFTAGLRRRGRPTRFSEDYDDDPEIDIIDDR